MVITRWSGGPSCSLDPAHGVLIGDWEARVCSGRLVPAPRPRVRGSAAGLASCAAAVQPSPPRVVVSRSWLATEGALGAPLAPLCWALSEAGYLAFQEDSSLLPVTP